LARLKEKGIQHMTWKVYLGCWCSDSEKLLPEFESIREALDIPRENIRYFVLDIEKKSPEQNEKVDSIAFLPTFILYSGETELGRIVETAKPNLESAILALLP